MTDETEQHGKVPPPLAPKPAGPPRTISSKELLGTAREVYIEHAGEVYRLRLTRNGKLILHK